MDMHLIFSLITFLSTTLAIFFFRSWSTHDTTLILSVTSIIISVGLIVFKYSLFKKYRYREDALFINICLSQIVASIVPIMVLFIGVTDNPSWVYFHVLVLCEIIIGNMDIFGGGSLVLIILSSAILYWMPILSRLNLIFW